MATTNTSYSTEGDTVGRECPVAVVSAVVGGGDFFSSRLCTWGSMLFAGSSDGRGELLCRRLL